MLQQTSTIFLLGQSVCPTNSRRWRFCWFAPSIRWTFRPWDPPLRMRKPRRTRRARRTRSRSMGDVSMSGGCSVESWGSWQVWCLWIRAASLDEWVVHGCAGLLGETSLIRIGCLFWHVVYYHVCHVFVACGCQMFAIYTLRSGWFSDWSLCRFFLE